MISRCDLTICGIVLSSVDVEVFIRHELQEIVAGARMLCFNPCFCCHEKVSPPVDLDQCLPPLAMLSPNP